MLSPAEVPKRRSRPLPSRGFAAPPRKRSVPHGPTSSSGGAGDGRPRPPQLGTLLPTIRTAMSPGCASPAGSSPSVPKLLLAVHGRDLSSIDEHLPRSSTRDKLVALKAAAVRGYKDLVQRILAETDKASVADLLEGISHNEIRTMIEEQIDAQSGTTLFSAAGDRIFIPPLDFSAIPTVAESEKHKPTTTSLAKFAKDFKGGSVPSSGAGGGTPKVGMPPHLQEKLKQAQEKEARVWDERQQQQQQQQQQHAVVPSFGAKGGGGGGPGKAKSSFSFSALETGTGVFADQQAEVDGNTSAENDGDPLQGFGTQRPSPIRTKRVQSVHANMGLLRLGGGSPAILAAGGSATKSAKGKDRTPPKKGSLTEADVRTPTSALIGGGGKGAREPPSAGAGSDGARTPVFRSSVLGDAYSRNNIQWKRGKPLGRGQFGAVYLAKDTDTGEVIAVKQMVVDTADQLQAIEKEVELMCRACFRNNNVVKCMGWSVGDEYGTEVGGAAAPKPIVGSIFNIFMEYVPRGTISDLVGQHGPLNEILLRNYTRQVLLGLRSLHAAGIAHRDIKGQNLLLGEDNVVKVADFGSAKHIVKKGVAGATLASTAAGHASMQGSPLWMAPEVIKQQVEADVQAWKRADVWSLACTVIEMATGKPPWNNFSNPTAAMWVLGSTPRTKSAVFHIASCTEPPPLPPNLHPEGTRFLKKCFAIDPGKRPTVAMLLYHPYMRVDYVDMHGQYCPPPRSDDED